MDVNKIRLIGVETVDLPIVVAKPSDPYILKDASGLGPPGADVAIAPSTVQGGTYQGRRPINREMVLRVGLTPNYKLGQTPASLRETMYGMLTPEAADAISVQLMLNDVVVAQTFGYANKIEPVLFTKEPEVQITIPCTEPYFSSPNEVTFVPDAVNVFTMPNEGSAPTGFEMELTFTEARDSWTFFGLGAEKMRFDYAFADGDILHINTIPEQRSITRKRGANTANIIHSLSADSVWIMLRGGNNLFNPVGITYKWGYIRYTPQYWGI